VRKNIIWIASYPKSGSTWIRSIIVNILYSKNYNFNFELLRNIIEFDIPKNYNFLLPKNIDEFNNLNKIETLSKFWIKAQSNYNLLGDKKIFKTHSANISFQGNHYTIPETTRGLIYVLRDPRDVVISYAKHLNKKIDDVIFLLAQENATTYSAKGDYPIILSRWDYHIKSWLDLKVPKFIIKYEHLLENTSGVIKQLISFLNTSLGYKIDIDNDTLNEIINQTSFDSLRYKEINDGFPEATKNTLFFREGLKNQWKKELSLDQQKKIQNLFKNAMNHFDYN